MISGFDDVMWGQPGADPQIADVITSIRAAGRVGLPVVEHNFTPTGSSKAARRRLAARARRLHGVRLFPGVQPAAARVCRDALACRSAEAGRALPEAVVPEAERANVRLAPPNDPPVPISRGSEQLMATVEH
jgi:mannonate dehydratase